MMLWWHQDAELQIYVWQIFAVKFWTKRLFMNQKEETKSSYRVFFALTLWETHFRIYKLFTVTFSKEYIACSYFVTGVDSEHNQHCIYI